MSLGKKAAFRLCVFSVFLVFLSGCGKNPEQVLEEADNLFVQARSMYEQRRYEEVIRALREAIVLNGQIRRDSSLGENYILLAQTQRMLGHYDSALTEFKTAIEIFRTSTDKKRGRNGRIALAGFYAELRNYRSALTLASDAAAESRFFGDVPSLIQSLKIVADANRHLGRYEQALSALDELTADKKPGLATRSKYDVFNTKLETSTAAGQLDLSRKIYSQWKKLALSNNDTTALARAYMSWGKIQQSLSHPDSAVRAFSQALDFLNIRSERLVQAEVLIYLGNLAYESKRFDNALPYYQDAKELVRETNNIVTEQILDLIIIACQWKSGTQSNQVAEFTKRVVPVKDVCQQSGFYAGEAFSDVLLGRFAEQSNNLPGASKYYSHARELFEQSASSFKLGSPNDEILQVFLNQEQSGWYDGMAQLYSSLGKPDELFEAVEGNNLTDLQEFFSDLTMKPADANLGKQIEEFQFKRNSTRLLENDILRELRAGTKRDQDLLQALKEQHALSVEELSSMSKMLGNSNQNFHWLLWSRSLKLNDVQKKLPPGSAIIEYVPLAGSVSIIVATHETAVIRKAAISKQNLLSLVQEYNRIIGDARLNGNVPMFNETGALIRMNELSPVLYNYLIAPVIPVLDNVTQVYIVPPAEFGWLPFHTLRPGGGEQTLIARMSVSYLPSAAALLFNQPKEKYVEDVVGFGHVGRTNWDVEYELKDIRSFYDKAKMLFDTAATLGRLKEMTYDVLHIGTEFFLDTNIPDKSVMVTADGVTPEGLHNVPLGDLMTIPVPSTLVFSDIAGKGGGLSRYAPMLFLANGSQTVVTAMWQGERKAKRYFGEIFYTNLMAGISSKDAYQNAMVSLTKHTESTSLHRWGLYYRFGK